MWTKSGQFVEIFYTLEWPREGGGEGSDNDRGSVCGIGRLARLCFRPNIQIPAICKHQTLHQKAIAISSPSDFFFFTTITLDPAKPKCTLHQIPSTFARSHFYQFALMMLIESAERRDVLGNIRGSLICITGCIERPCV